MNRLFFFLTHLKNKFNDNVFDNDFKYDRILSHILLA